MDAAGRVSRVSVRPCAGSRGPCADCGRIVSRRARRVETATRSLVQLCARCERALAARQGSREGATW